jgi:hypothetical protein
MFHLIELYKISPTWGGGGAGGHRHSCNAETKASNGCKGFKAGYDIEKDSFLIGSCLIGKGSCSNKNLPNVGIW